MSSEQGSMIGTEVNDKYFVFPKDAILSVCVQILRLSLISEGTVLVNCKEAHFRITGWIASFEPGSTNGAVPSTGFGIVVVKAYPGE